MNIFLDCCNYFGDNSNFGDIAIYQVVEHRIRAFAPNAWVRIATFDPDTIQRACPSLTPFVLPGRELHGNRLLQQAVSDSDLVMGIGGGCLSDEFARHGVHLLRVLKLAKSRGKRAALLSCGFEPVTNPALSAALNATLPALDWVSCREGFHGPRLLRSLGRRRESFEISGDAAFELARRHATDEVGADLGVSFRLAEYARTRPEHVCRIAAVLGPAARSYGAALRPLPISLVGPCDLSAMRTAFGDFPAASEVRYETPADLIHETGRCRLVVTGTYHAAVFAAAQGIPFVGLAESRHYRSKLEGLRDLLPGGGTVLDLGSPRLESELREAVDRFWESAPYVRAGLRKTVDQLIQSSKRNFARIFERAGVRTQPAERRTVERESEPVEQAIS